MDDVTTASNASSSFAPTRTQQEIAFIAPILLSLIIVSVLGNILVIASIKASSTLNSQVSNIFIINLSLADLLTAMTVMTTSFVTLVTDVNYVHPIWCGFVCGANYCFIIVSMTTLSSISLDRYCAVVHTYEYESIVTRPRVIAMCIYVWTQGLVFAAAPIQQKWIDYDYWEVICAIDWRLQYTMIYVIAAFIINFALPGFLMVFCYIHILREAKRSQKRIAQCTVQRPDNNKSSDEAKRALKMITSLFIVVACFFFCMTPFCITKLLKVVTTKAIVPPYANLTASFCQFTSSILNPLIYGIFRSDFRQSYRRLLRWLPCKFFRNDSGFTTDAPGRSGDINIQDL